MFPPKYPVGDTRVFKPASNERAELHDKYTSTSALQHPDSPGSQSELDGIEPSSSKRQRRQLKLSIPVNHSGRKQAPDTFAILLDHIDLSSHFQESPDQSFVRRRGR